MCNEFEYVIHRTLMLSDVKHEFREETEPIKSLEFEYRNFLDRFAIDSIVRSFENSEIIKALLVLPRVERIILAFQYIFDMEIYEIANILDADIRSIYVQKGTAIKKLKKEFEHNKIAGGDFFERKL